MRAMNPYRNRGPLRRHDEFFGRRRELQEIYRAVTHGHYVSLVGERRVGKTSILNALRFEEFRRAYGVPAEFVFVFVNSQYCSAGCEEDFITLLVNQIGREMQTATRGSALDVLHAVGREIQAQAAPRQLVVMLDEVDVLVHNPNISTGFFSFLRAWTEEFQVPFVVASKEGSVDRLLDAGAAGSPFWNLFQPLYVGPLTPAEAEQLVRVPAARCDVHFTDAEVANILAMGGHQPYFLQIACDRMFEAKAGGATPDPEAVLHEFRFAADAHLRYLIDHIPAIERDGLAAFLAGGIRPDPRTTSELLRKGVLIADGGTLRVFSSALVPMFQADATAAAAGQRFAFLQRAADFFRE
jgi:hypothetical protein